MKRYKGTINIAAIAVAILCLTSGIAYAAPEGPNSLEASADFLYFDYKESLPSPFKSTEKGWIPGGRLIYSYQGVDNPLYGRLLGEFFDGEIDYDGTTQEGTPVKAKSDATILIGEANIGYNIKPIKVIVYTGIGYRDWNRKVGEQYSEDYRWKYWPIGLRGNYRINEKLSGAIDVSARYAFGGTIKVYLSDFNPGYNNPKADLGEKWGFKVEAPIEYKLLEPNWTFVTTPWYEYSAIGKSNIFDITYQGIPDGSGYEPSSKTRQYGINLGVKYRF